MSRTKRLLELLEILRAHRYPVTASTISERLSVSVRTVYRDISELQQQGVRIEGGAGIGYIIKSDYHLPPLMFSAHEINALTLGLNWVCQNTDTDFKKIAKNAIAKIHAVIPDNLREHIEYQSLITGPDNTEEKFFCDIRHSINTCSKAKLRYIDKKSTVSSRTIWPIALAYMDSCWLLVGWCEMRNDFRHFRTDRILDFSPMDARYDERRSVLLNRWRKAEGISIGQEY
ncbi:helix-turn-helix transcriptional regulator [Shewanella fodinae]|uniref:Putative DNA-binding transcriptional regulator YafY n=1 Tax=Shewanella fodinae TaxID=552357 RepID=A0A4R2FEV3_9GAMM|nr:YafY family protein [Shewanella fodinae]TCN83616.1 putative DNA-binding transcriptional regulator YafY [Shewanella fodinae]